jgi:hypothetical protein
LFSLDRDSRTGKKQRRATAQIQQPNKSMKVINGGNNFCQKFKPSFTHALIIISTLLTAIGSGLAQTLQQSDSGSVAQPDSIVQITAEAEGLTQVDPTTLPPFASCWWTVYPDGGPVPMPYLPDPSVPIYEIVPGSGIYLVDMTGGAVSMSVPRTGAMASTTSSTVAFAVERQGNEIANLIEQVQETQSEQTMSMAFGMDVPFPGDGGGGTNSYTPDGSGFVIADYGTNLWIAQTAVAAGNLTGIGTNTIADVQYEIQSVTNLLQSDWHSEGFIYGSEGTNWTPLSVAQLGRTNLFIRLKSWADDGSGLPIWWQLEYFGTTGVDPYGDPAGDGYSNLQKFQLGWNPNTFYTPVAPSGVTVDYLADMAQADVQWQASAGNVVGYQVEKTYEGQGGNFDYVFSTNDVDVSSNTLSLDDDVSGETTDDEFDFPGFNDYFKVRAHYANGQYSNWSSKKPLKTSFLTASLVYGADGQASIALSGVPAGTTAIRFYYEDYDAFEYYGEPPINFSNDVPYSLFTNGIYALPDSLQPPTSDMYGPDVQGYIIYAQPVDATGNATDLAYFYQGLGWKQPFYDGRVQLKQNLIFKLRAADVDKPFRFYYSDTNDFYAYYAELYYPPTNHVESSLLHITDILTDTNYFNPNDYYAFHSTLIDPQLPFFENYLFYNFADVSANVDANGLLNTGVGYDGYSDMELSSTPAWRFQAPSGAWTNLPGLFDESSPSFINSLPIESYGDTDYSELFENEVSYNSGAFSLASGAANLYGLSFSAEKIAGHALPNNVIAYNLTPGNTSPLYSFDAGPVLYAGTAQPELQLIDYYFASPVPIWNPAIVRYVAPWLPGSQYFSPTNQSQQFYVPVGSSVQVAGYAKFSLENGASGAYAYLGQYFDQAYETTNDTATATPTGILSPYGNFFATEAGDAALVTMPDLDTGARGTGIVHCVSIQLDKNHDGVMNPSFSGPDVTSQASPMTCWVNNNYDRGHTVDGSDFEQDDLGAADISRLPAYQQVPDCDYVDASGYPSIPSTRDLEDYFRLWLSGIGAAMKSMPTNYTVQLTLTGSGQIRLFQAVEPNGGTNYLFDEPTASNQVFYLRHCTLVC